MNHRNPHQALKHEVTGKAGSKNASFVLVKSQWGKNEVGFSLHAAPSTFTTYGVQVPDFLNNLGFRRSPCSFVDRQECYVRWVDREFDVGNFANLFDQAYRDLGEAQTSLEKCGFFFDQPEGWGYHFGKPSEGRQINIQMGGDGHTAAKSKLMKTSEDNSFIFKFTWLENNEGDKGWVIHYCPKHPPLSSEIQSVLQYLGIKSFDQCPHFDFEPCSWRSIKFISRGDDFDGNADSAHGWFDAHTEHFSPGIQKLLSANANIEKAGLRFLPFPDPKSRIGTDIEKRVIHPAPRRSRIERFDVAISFAGAERSYAKKLATFLRDTGASVFYDAFYPEELWGKNLVDLFDEIYRKRARYCVIFVSKEYKERMWANHERQSAQARALEEKGTEYILPIKVDDTELPGMPPTIGYLSLGVGIKKIGEVLIKKLQKPR